MRKILLLILVTFTIGTSSVRSENSEQIQPDSSIINIQEIQKLKLYPNPASTYLFIDYDVLFVKEAKLQIYNSIGAVVYTKKLEEKKGNIKVSVSDFKNGLYFCSLQIDGKLLNTRKILINH